MMLTKSVSCAMFYMLIWITLLCMQTTTVLSSDGSPPIRLVDGPTPFEGRLEVYHDNKWGSVCDDGIGMREAEVVCRQLGHNHICFKKEAFYGEGSGPIMLDNVRCAGNESSIDECNHNGWYNHNCFHDEDAGFICEWDEFTVRVHHDTCRRQVAGRVEIYYNDTWNTVCNNEWGMHDAHVACKQVGYETAAQIISTRHFDPANGDILLSDMACTGEEDTIIECPHPGLYENSCKDNHMYDAGVVCFDSIDGYDLRLVDDNIYDDLFDRGLVQMYINGSWGSICSDGWGPEDAEVVCRQLGYAGGQHSSLKTPIGEEMSFYLTYFGCHGHEDKLIDCYHNEATVCNLGASVSCQGPRVRLSGGPTRHEGRVEVLHHGKWGTICGTDEDYKTANLICNQLGYDKARKVILDGYGATDNPIMLSNVVCDDGIDGYLSECTHSGWFVHNCDHSQDLGITCDPGPIFRVRLVDDRNTGSGASIAFEGKVEMFVDGAWGSICDTNWDQDDADVVCKELGFYAGALQATGGDYFGEGTGKILMDNVTCNEHYQHLSHCQHSGWYQYDDRCMNTHVAGVVCDPGMESPIRLVNDIQNKYQGTVEMFHKNSWVAVCISGSWGLPEANVVCRQLFNRENNQLLDLVSRPSNGANHLQLVSCGGWEFSLTECEHNGWYYCNEHTVPSVYCIPEDTDHNEGDIRLMDGARAWEGRVEYYHNGLWGSVCDANWDHSDARVVCRQLGYPEAFDVSTGSEFGFGSGVIHFDSVDCIGTEEKLEYCFRLGWGGGDCDVTKEAGVVCGIEDGTLRLAEGKNEYEGRIEIHYQGVWGTICDALWGLNDAQVACKQLGYGDAVDAYYSAYFGEGSGPVLLDYVSCYGYESRIDECQRGDWFDTDCDHTRDAGIKCEDPNGTSQQSGFTNIALILGLVLALLCILLWCYKPLRRFLTKYRENNDPNNRTINEVSYPGSEFEVIPDCDLPTYQDATADIPPLYDHLYGEAAENSHQEGMENRGQINDEVETVNDQIANVPPATHVATNDDDCVRESVALSTGSTTQSNITIPNDAAEPQIFENGELDSGPDQSDIRNNVEEQGSNNDELADSLPVEEGHTVEEAAQKQEQIPVSVNMEDVISNIPVVLPNNDVANELGLGDKICDGPTAQVSLTEISENNECYV